MPSESPTTPTIHRITPEQKLENDMTNTESSFAEMAALRINLLEIEQHCPCGARPESLNTHPHVTGCPVASAIQRIKRLTAAPTPAPEKALGDDGVAIEIIAETLVQLSAKRKPWDETLWAKKILTALKASRPAALRSLAPVPEK